MPRLMTIGTLAKAAGVNVETIRYYQRIGLLREPPRPPGGQRRYAEPTVAEVAFVRRGQQLGFTLSDIKELLQLAKSGTGRDVRKIAEVRYSRLALHTKQLMTMTRNLKALLKQSRRYKGRGADPIIVVLRGEKPLPSEAGG